MEEIYLFRTILRWLFGLLMISSILSKCVIGGDDLGGEIGWKIG